MEIVEFNVSLRNFCHAKGIFLDQSVRCLKLLCQLVYLQQHHSYFARNALIRLMNLKDDTHFRCGTGESTGQRFTEYEN